VAHVVTRSTEGSGHDRLQPGGHNIPSTTRQLLTAKFSQGIPILALNSSGAEVALGSVVVLDTAVTDDLAFTTSSTQDTDQVFGVTIESVPDGVRGRVQVAGIVEKVRAAAGTDRYEYLRQSATVGVAEGTASPTVGTFSRALTSRDAAGYVQAVLGYYPPSGAVVSGLSNYGDGSDGDVTISIDTTLTSSKNYQNLTVNTGVVLNAGGYHIFVNDTATITGTVSNDGGAGGNGTAGENAKGGGALGGAAGSNGAAAGAGVLSGTVASVNGGAGGNAALGVGGNGTAGTAGTNVTSSVGGSAGSNGGTGGDGGAIGGTAGGAGGAAGTGGTRTAAVTAFRNLVNVILFRMVDSSTNLLVPYGSGGTAGSGGGGSGAATVTIDNGGAGGGAGGMGGNAGSLLLAARTLTGAGAIRCRGGAGGNGAVGGNGAAGGGGAGGGGGGGAAGSGGSGGLCVVISTDSSGWSGTITAPGGAAGTVGTGGTGAGGGASGSNGGAGNAGAAGVAIHFQDAD
jgi:hypothetical protein